MGLDLVALLAFVLGSIFLKRVIICGLCGYLFSSFWALIGFSLIDS
jgi:hypothetical protein